MQIITIEDQEFNDLLTAWNNGIKVGRFWRNGSMQIICATKNFLLISNGESPGKIAIRPARSQSEAIFLAIQQLENEQARGNKVEMIQATQGDS